MVANPSTARVAVPPPEVRVPDVHSIEIGTSPHLDVKPARTPVEEQHKWFAMRADRAEEMTGFKILKSWLGGYATKRLVGTKLRSYCSGESCSGELESVSGNPSLRTLTCASDAVHVDVPGAA